MPYVTYVTYVTIPPIVIEVGVNLGVDINNTQSESARASRRSLTYVTHVTYLTHLTYVIYLTDATYKMRYILRSRI